MRDVATDVRAAMSSSHRWIPLAGSSMTRDVFSFGGVPFASRRCFHHHRRARLIPLIGALLFAWFACGCDCPPRGDDVQTSTTNASSEERRTALAITAGGNHACALLEGGSVACWGSNGSGQLGDGSTHDRPTPVRFELSGEATEVHAGFAATCAKARGGDLRCSGRPLPGLLEDGHARPSAVTALEGAQQIVGGRLHGCALNKDGRVACWGGNYFGQLGDDTARGCKEILVERRQEPGFVPSVNDAEAIAMGDTGACARLKTGTVRCWGRIGFPKALGVETRCKAATFAGLDQVKQVVVGSHHGCALRENGTVYCWGTNAIGQLGVMRDQSALDGHVGGGGDLSGPFPPVKVATIDDAVEIASFGRAHSCARRRSGQVVCWGRNVEGQLGDGTTTNRFAPVSVVGLGDATAIATGYDFSCALRRGGRVLCWGENEQGGLGDGTRLQRSRPVEVDL